MHIRFRGDRSRIVQLVLRDAEGERVEASHARLEPVAEVPGEWVAVVRVGGEARLVEVRYALGVDERSLPFAVALRD